jgi:hypothetical protein
MYRVFVLFMRGLGCLKGCPTNLVPRLFVLKLVLKVQNLTAKAFLLKWRQNKKLTV